MLLALAVVPVAGAQQTWQQAVNGALQSFAATARSQGFSPASPVLTGSLNSGATQNIPLPLTASREYIVAGACDQDCGNFDLRIFGPDDRQLAEDVDADTRPLLSFTAPATGQYRLVAIMTRCSSNPCFYGVQLFGK
jgi:hypothetical protein